MQDLKYLVVEYFPHMMDGDEMIPARIDGHYLDRAEAEDIAEFWAEEPKHCESRIVVVEVLAEAKEPAHWRKL